MKYWIGVLALVSVLVVNAQSIEGTIRDDVSKGPLPGATVQVISSDLGAVTDTLGFYRMRDLEPGRYSLKISFVGYKETIIQDVWVKAGKITLQDVELEEKPASLDEIVVSGSRNVVEPGKLTITEEQINRFASTYYDPARLMTSSPDVAVTNDQNNRISVRGLSPTYNTWRLEGAEIVNPNHLSNAGTFLDKPTPTGGGVNMISAQMLDRSSFLYSSFNSAYGNSVGGIFDMRLKTGNRQQRQYTAQASLIGLDIATDGPFKKGGKATYAGNYRYSFTGLLTSFGVNFGGESIGFQDLSFNVATPLGRRTSLKVFGVGGLSFNNFNHKPYAESESEKDRKDIYYKNATGIVGTSMTTRWSVSSLVTSLVYSNAGSKHNVYNYDQNDQRTRSDLYNNQNGILSLSSIYSRKVGQVQTQLGVLANSYQYNLKNSSNENQSLLRPFVDLSGNLTANLLWNAGVSAMITQGDAQVNPRGSLTYLAGANHNFKVAAGRYGQLLNRYNYYFNNYTNEILPTPQPGIQSSWRYTLSHSFNSKFVSVNTELFYYNYPTVSVVDLGTKSAYTRGVSTSLERSFDKGYYLRTGVSLFDSKIGNQENHYNTRFNATLATGKEWNTSRNGKDKRFSVNVRGMYQGGKYFPIVHYNILHSPFDGYLPFRTDPYLRFDLRLLWTRYRANRTSSLAIDLQNVANIKNQAYLYTDSFTGKTVMQYQLGLIPILAYRVEW